jgi:pimeloyl-ACP methyl ester carboxylesterase
MKKIVFLIAALLLIFLLIGPYLIPLPTQPDLSADAVAPGTGRFLTVDGVRTYIQDIGPREASATIVGHSMGAGVVGHFAALYPDRVDNLVFVDGAPSTADGDEGFNFLSYLVRFPPIRQWARFIMRWQLDEEAVAERLRSAYYDPDFVTEEIESNYLAPQRIKDWELALLGIMRDSGENNLAAPVQDYTSAPALIIWGEEDTWVPLSSGNAFSESMPDAEYVIIPDSGHLPMEEQAELFNATLLKFLRR